APQILDRGRHHAGQDDDRDRQQDVRELAAPCGDLDELCLDFHWTHLKAITPNSERQRVRTALPSLPECTSHRPRLSGPSQISPTWCGQTTTTPATGPRAATPSRAHSRARARRGSVLCLSPIM